MKVAPIMAALDADGHDTALVHTGQHYDPQMSDTFFAQLGLPAADVLARRWLGDARSANGQIMERFEPVLLEARPDWVVVVGDVNSTLAVALVVSKRREELGCGLAHVEAGLRSGDWRMPEEINRVVTDQLSDLLLTPSADARENLLREGTPERFDSLCRQRDDRYTRRPARRGQTAVHGNAAGCWEATMSWPRCIGLERRRSANAVRAARAFARIAHDRPLVLPLHPGHAQRRLNSVSSGFSSRCEVTEPLGYLEMLGLTDGAAVVLTDSVDYRKKQQRSASRASRCASKPRDQSRSLTARIGSCVAACVDGIIEAYEDALIRRDDRASIPDGWDGHAAERIAAALADTEPGARLRL
jgi:UDP-N-acetylglucosamine 2-epimerase (non-hydrolysing)